MNLKEIKEPNFIKKLNEEELEELAVDIREFLIQEVSQTGGHFSSNLGIVELTMALHFVFDSPKDKFIFDVGHQSYVHKILTGRAKDFATLRQFNGLSGFQKRKESLHDVWEAGHSSTALSGAIGMAIARDLRKEEGEIIPIVGDAAIMSGESFEALNHIGSIDAKVIIVLNDNDMSISKNVGGLSNFLSEVRISSQYTHAKNNYVSFLNRSQIGRKVYKLTKKMKDKVKKNVFADTIFNEFGIDYIGPVDGHNFRELMNAFQVAKDLNHSVVIHVHTTKGKGYLLAENDKQGIYHGVGPFDYHRGIVCSDSEHTSWSEIISSQVHQLMSKDKDIITITPAMIAGGCLESIFDDFPQRSFDVGIAEEHALTFAAGLAVGNMKPYIHIYSSFLQRAYDQLNHDIARMNLPCLIAVDRAGLVGADGETHHGVFDISFLSAIPNIILMTPRHAGEARMMVNSAFHYADCPYLIRVPRGMTLDCTVDCDSVIEIGCWEEVYMHPSNSLTVITYDMKVDKVKTLIDNHQLPINLINARFIKPLDYRMLDKLHLNNQDIIVYETDLQIGSLGSMIAKYYSQNQMTMTIQYLGIDDRYTPQGSIEDLQKYEKISIDDLLVMIKENLNEKRKN